MIYHNHIGYLPDAKKEFIADPGDGEVFEIQDMTEVVQEQFGKEENWKPVYKGMLEKTETLLGKFCTGNFSQLTQPGIYRIYLPEKSIGSYQFIISAGVFHQIPSLFLDFLHNWRSGDFSNAYRGKTHMDDGRRSDNGNQIDATGGWYDAGDTRKWMVHTNLPAIGFFDLVEKLSFTRSHFISENKSGNDFITESMWALEFILKMQDPETGMFFEDVGGGGATRFAEGMGWWYDNHAGCMADNGENHFTDNIPESGDERTVRVTYNPIAQYTSIYILLRACPHIAEEQPQLAEKCLQAALRNWRFMEKKKNEGDMFHGWTSVRSWRLMAAHALHDNNSLSVTELNIAIAELLKLFNPGTGFWYMDDRKKDSYRGILHSAQPVIALCRALDSEIPIEKQLQEEIIQKLTLTADRYVSNLSLLNPFGFMPFGLYFEKKSEKDLYRSYDDMYLRFFMPVHAKQRIVHGLGGHWTSWAHALALAGKILKSNELTDAAWNQLYWLLGKNPYNASLITGIGYNHPMPHSRYLGTLPGGFMNGFIGTEEDLPFLDMERKAQWNSTEYWNTPLANSMMALAILLENYQDGPELRIGKIN